MLDSSSRSELHEPELGPGQAQQGHERPTAPPCQRGREQPEAADAVRMAQPDLQCDAAAEAVADQVNPVELERIVSDWRDDLSNKAQDYLPTSLNWPEGMAPPHFVTYIGAGGRSGMLLGAAYAQNPSLPRPAGFVENWRQDPAVMLCLANRVGAPLFNIVNSGLWLPGNFKFGTQFGDPAGVLVQIGSVGLLKMALDSINASVFQASVEDIVGWQANGLHKESGFEGQARFGFATFYVMCRLALENGLPMKMHY